MPFTIYSDFNFENHIKNITSFYHLRNIATVTPCLSQGDTERLMHAFITSRLDYFNTVLSALTKKAIGQLQMIQNAAARVLTKTRQRAHFTPVLQSLHWLPVSYWIDFHNILLVNISYLIVMHLNVFPAYFQDVHRIEPWGFLAQNSEQFQKPGPRDMEAAFSFYPPSLWNTLPENRRMAETAN